MPLKALTLDLDDTLWPSAPAIAAAEKKLHAWLEREAPRMAAALPPPAFMVESYLDVALAIRDPDHAGPVIDELKSRRSEFEARKVYWRNAPVAAELRPDLDAVLSAEIGRAHV